MLQTGDFWVGFAIALMAVGAVTILVVVIFAAYKIWQWSQPILTWLANSWAVRMIQTLASFTNNVVKSILEFLIVRPWQFGKNVLIALVEVLANVPWGAVFQGIFTLCLAAIPILLPFTVLTVADIPAPAIAGIATAGAMLGFFVGIILFFAYRKDGLSQALGMFMASVPIGAWGSAFLIAVLIAMSSD